mmetsp:Transcript_77524/g.107696  ORF Transcript_77524/g.107696 Transcript_77524/m.107696 type:complete len:249 (+) Transcript_77524:125-871(+)
MPDRLLVVFGHLTDRVFHPSEEQRVPSGEAHERRCFSMSTGRVILPRGGAHPGGPLLDCKQVEGAMILANHPHTGPGTTIGHLPACKCPAGFVAAVGAHGPEIDGAGLWDDHAPLSCHFIGACLVAQRLADDRRGTEVRAAGEGHHLVGRDFCALLEIDLASIHVALPFGVGGIHICIRHQVLVGVVADHVMSVTLVTGPHANNGSQPEASRQGHGLSARHPPPEEEHSRPGHVHAESDGQEGAESRR